MRLNDEFENAKREAPDDGRVARFALNVNAEQDLSGTKSRELGMRYRVDLMKKTRLKCLTPQEVTKLEPLREPWFEKAVGGFCRAWPVRARPKLAVF